MIGSVLLWSWQGLQRCGIIACSQQRGTRALVDFKQPKPCRVARKALRANRQRQLAQEASRTNHKGNILKDIADSFIITASSFLSEHRAVNQPFTATRRTCYQMLLQNSPDVQNYDRTSVAPLGVPGACSLRAKRWGSFDFRRRSRFAAGTASHSVSGASLAWR